MSPFVLTANYPASRLTCLGMVLRSKATKNREPAGKGAFPRIILFPGFAGSRFFVAFARDTLLKQVSLLAGQLLT